MVKKLVEKWVRMQHHSFIVKRYPISYDEPNNQQMVLRQHDELEITMLLGCNGKRCVGNTIESFSHVDLFMLGPRLQHSTRVDDGEAGEAYTLHFLPETFGTAFFDLPECAPIARLFTDAHMGLAFEKFDVNRVRDHFEHLGCATGFDRVLSFLNLLDYLANVPQRRKLSSRVFAPIENKKDYDTVNLAYGYIVTHFKDDHITLEDISKHLNMSSATFCRYFKKHFHKTFTAFLNEVRIGHACKLLQDTEQNVAEIAYGSGYRQLTHFNRQFKRLMGRTPKQYRDELQYRKN